MFRYGIRKVWRQFLQTHQLPRLRSQLQERLRKGELIAGGISAVEDDTTPAIFYRRRAGDEGLNCHCA